MCTFIITNDKKIDNQLDLLSALGGPSASNTVIINGITVKHNLLSITGKLTVQPIQVDQKYFMLMGEIYNYDKKHPSDIYTAIDMYLQYGNSFTEYLDGEFLIVIFDKENDTIDFYTDPWATRQAYFYQKNDIFYFSTLPLREPKIIRHRTVPYFILDDIQLKKSFIDHDLEWIQHYEQLPHNSHCRYDIKQKKLSTINNNLHIWNLDQPTDDLKNVTEAFEQAVLKRYVNNSVLYLSGGIDSSAIAACLSDHKKSFNSITLRLTEIEDKVSFDSIINYTKEYNNNHIIDKSLSPSNDLQSLREVLIRRRFLTKLATPQMIIREKTKKIFGSNVVLVGNGSDEIIDNYMSKQLSEFSEWPETLSTIFPWTHFYNGFCRRLIPFHETISLAYGLELRNIYYDKHLVQTWINTTPRLKNKESKHFLRQYLSNRQITISNAKAGFHQQYHEEV